MVVVAVAVAVIAAVVVAVAVAVVVALVVLPRQRGKRQNPALPHPVAGPTPLRC